jgi:hypothetical protein
MTVFMLVMEWIFILILICNIYVTLTVLTQYVIVEKYNVYDLKSYEINSSRFFFAVVVHLYFCEISGFEPGELP